MELNKETTSFARNEARDLWKIVNLGISYEADDDPEQRSMCELIQNSVDNVFLEAGMTIENLTEPITVDTRALRIVGFHGALALGHSEAVIRSFCSQFDGCSTDYFPEQESDAYAAFDNLRTIVHHTYTELGLL